MLSSTVKTDSWKQQKIRWDEIDRYLHGGRDFIDDAALAAAIGANRSPDPARIRDIIAKSLAIETLAIDDAAALLNVTDPDLLAEMEAAAGQIKRHVYDNRIVTFAPLYLSNHCVNNCRYCGFRRENRNIRRVTLSMDEIRRETEVLCGRIGHKRLIVVYGEHPVSDIDYMVDSIAAIYDVAVPVHQGTGRIRRVNVNAAPLCIQDLERLKTVGIGTFQVFQETYHHATYARIHPADTLKGNYQWRLYCMHRAFEAGVDDFGIGALFGLADWRFEVLGLLAHAHELERAVGIGPHTISFPRLEPAENTPFLQDARLRVADADFRKAVTVLRLAVPYTGMILTARESADTRRALMPLGITQIDASSRIGVGAYADGTADHVQDNRQQFVLGDTRSLDAVIRELAQMGTITSFCTAGYRCGRTGKRIMDLLRSGREGRFCKLNAVLTYREWLDDFASPETAAAAEPVVQREIEAIGRQQPETIDAFMAYYQRIVAGERDLYF
ncbi:[FeFe] hydrogenase H-cluster radical SAM maturase HydG [uncultured Desulfosarcina sp.]|uniref:[FeFe] hydrogenase H-cluster radical SAM maturase HydG n=1 Tax=uncultured Desulfosarcina sp. TaxID=218289 RepID=UPI0029C795E8|nr:[FeFe] hydrogenase H-cluster radical SAM maturase HydG [uncultured Desulfosarcina sp.]